MSRTPKLNVHVIVFKLDEHLYKEHIMKLFNNNAHNYTVLYQKQNNKCIVQQLKHAFLANLKSLFCNSVQ